MEDVISSVSLNLSSQANTIRLNRTNLYQFNCVVILGLDCLENAERDEEKIPVSFSIDKTGDMTIKGIDVDVVNNDNISIHSDKKVTTSEDLCT